MPHLANGLDHELGMGIKYLKKKPAQKLDPLNDARCRGLLRGHLLCDVVVQ